MKSGPPTALQSRLLRLILRVTASLGVLVYVPSVYISLQHDMFGMIAMDTLAIALVVALVRMERLSYRFRASALCLVFYALGVGLLLAVGSISQIYLFGFSILTVLLLGLRPGMAAAALSSCSMLVVGALGRASPEIASRGMEYDFQGWAIVTINFTLVNVLLTLAVGVVLNDLHATKVDRDRTLEHLQIQIARMPLAYLLTDNELRYTRWNPAAEKVFGFSEAEVLGKHPFDVIVPLSAQPFVASIFERIRAGSMDAHGESENLTKARGTITCEWNNTPIFSADGAFEGLLSLAQDVTERRNLEGQLRQSQKMDAVGQLAGGVAHDFNNLLSVVLSYSDLMLEDLSPDSPLRADVEEIRSAGARAAELTRQLLLFSRHQVVEPKVLDLNVVMTGVDKMLRRLVGEDVELTTIAVPSIGRIHADPGSIEQVIVNLAVNARDAMPTGGRITMETANVTLDAEFAQTHLGAAPGEYVMLAVSDTGTGMDKATLARIFEPFFTTKGVGKGTGLGLSTVFGIVQRSGGSVWVYSERGIGTTFKVYLPRVDGEVDARRLSLSPGTLRGAETILLVEDEDAVRTVTAGILRRSGYTVIEARNAGEALLRSENEVGRIDLLLSDVVMPTMGGPALAKRLASLRPSMKVLCMSGYTDEAAVRHGVIMEELAYLQKPITVDSLTRKVREVLDQKLISAGSAR